MITKLREKKETGFSLLELSVAVGVAAIAASAGIVASTTFIGSAQDKRDDYTANADAAILNAESSSLALSISPIAPVSNAVASGVASDGATITWDVPNVTSPITGYTIIVDAGDGNTPVEYSAAANATSYVLTGLTPEISYTVTVRAVNANGSKDISLTVTTASVPARVVLTEATTGWNVLDNGLTITCDGANVGDSATLTIDEIETIITKRTAAQITSSNAETTCTSGITSMGNLFNGASTFNQDISHWDVSSVTDMGAVFRSASTFNQDISQWDTSNVTTMLLMFDKASDFNQDVGSWDTSKVGNMNYMFTDAKKFNQNIGSWDVENVEKMNLMFQGAEKFNQDLSGWCVPKISSKPSNFDTNTPDWVKTSRQPGWGCTP